METAPTVDKKKGLCRSPGRKSPPLSYLPSFIILTHLLHRSHLPLSQHQAPAPEQANTVHTKPLHTPHGHLGLFLCSCKLPAPHTSRRNDIWTIVAMWGVCGLLAEHKTQGRAPINKRRSSQSPFGHNSTVTMSAPSGPAPH